MQLRIPSSLFGALLPTNKQTCLHSLLKCFFAHSTRELFVCSFLWNFHCHFALDSVYHINLCSLVLNEHARTHARTNEPELLISLVLRRATSLTWFLFWCGANDAEDDDHIDSQLPSRSLHAYFWFFRRFAFEKKTQIRKSSRCCRASTSTPSRYEHDDARDENRHRHHHHNHKDDSARDNGTRRSARLGIHT